MSKKLYFGSNLKMYKNIKDTVEYLQKLVENTKDISREEIELFIIPSYTTLESATKNVDRAYVKLGAQNMCWEDEGQFTGEISPLMLKELGLDLVMIGHSERRQYFGETDETVNKKLKKLFEGPIRPILCVGESLEERDADKAFDVVGGQIKADLEGIDAADVKKLVIAYEPIWAIGTGRTATPDQAEEMCAFIRKTLIEIYGEEVSDEVIIQYGGSVKPANATEIMNMDEIDGALVGGASLKPEDFMEIIDF